MSDLRKGAITLKGDPIDLFGPQLKRGDKAPGFTCADGIKSTTNLAATSGKARLFSVVPSLDTPVCSIQTKTFAKQLNDLGDAVASYTISMDLPFAQGRFCSENQIANLKNLSDTHDQSFGRAYGVLIQGLAIPLLARAIFVVDPRDTITYVEYVPEIAQEPNYEAALAALRSAAGK